MGDGNFVSTVDRVKEALLLNADEPGSQRGLLLPWLFTSEDDFTKKFSQKSFSETIIEPSQQLTQTESSKVFFDPERTAEITEMYKKRKGITSLYSWQEDCLNCKTLLNRGNLIIAMPTSAGKTLVAEVLMLREILLQNRAAILVLPYVSLVQEKVRGLASLSLRFGFSVEEYAGGKGVFPPVRRRRQCLYVATIEKSSSLTSAFLDPTLFGSNKRFIKDIGLVIVDEVHMIGENERGAILEGTLIKLRAGFPNAQIVAMSATVGNLPELASCFNADIFQRDYRPVPLYEYVRCNKTLYKFVKETGTLEPTTTGDFGQVALPGQHPHPALQSFDKNLLGQLKRDTDDLFGLVGDLIYEKKQCLVFCATRRAAENAASLLSKIISAIYPPGHPEEDKVIQAKQESLIGQMIQENGGQCCPILKKTIPAGVAYHHAGLVPEERLLVEQAYSEGVITILCCTSTLAAGVNLPARRVVIRSPYVGPNFLTVDRYRQMAGRAGRAKLDTLGQCVTMCDPKDLQKMAAMIQAPLSPCRSDLQKILPWLSLEMTCIGIVKSISSLSQLISDYSLWYKQRDNTKKNLEQELTAVTNELVESGMLRITSDENTCERTFCPTALGRAAMVASLAPHAANYLLSDLKQAQAMITLASPLYLLYLIIPSDNVPELIDAIDYSILSREIGNMQLDTDLAALKLLNLSESHIARMRGSGSSTLSLSAASSVKLATALPYARLQLALALRYIWYGANYWTAASRLGLNRGAVYQLMGTATSYAHAAHRFAAQMPELWPMSDLMLSLNKRLIEAPLADLTELLDVPGVRYGRARQLHKAGYTTLATLATADPVKLSREIDHLSRRMAVDIIESAQVAVRESVRQLQDQAENIVEDTLTAALDLKNSESDDEEKLP